MNNKRFKTALSLASVFAMFFFVNTHVHAQAQVFCSPSDTQNGFGSGFSNNGEFYSWFELASDGSEDTCTNNLRVYNDQYSRHYRVEWSMPRTWGEDSIGGMGWNSGSRNRKVGYWAGQVTSNSPRQKALIALYGWSCYENGGQQISQEYYIVDHWAGPGTFVPWDENANGGSGGPASAISTVTANGATWNIYKVGRNGAQYCFNGADRQFEQYWSVRDNSNGTGQANNIDFRPHSNKWDNYGFKPQGLSDGYQILAVEVFGDANVNHSGAIDLSTWER